MDIRQYQMHDRTQSLALPVGARFLSAQWLHGWISLYFEHPNDWTRTQYWHLHSAQCDQNVKRHTGWEEYEFLGPALATGTFPTTFIFRKTD